MGQYYSLIGVSTDDGYGTIDSDAIPQTIIDACRRSEFQHIPANAIRVPGIPGPKGYLDLYIADGSVPLVSEKMRNVLYSAGVAAGEVLYRQAYVFDAYGHEEPYYLVLPQKINCMDRERTVIDPIGGTDSLYINDANVGCFRIFKVAGLTDKTIYVTEMLMEQILAAGLTGVEFVKL